ncbi:ArsS family sensor histidine kinase [Campylobacter troglodytis]|uniref:ArsS family sensor histidine kinase n=1 Tax=Campylobacter troglodytis TaxID=654363 RepID=UPI001159C9C7|nr:ArsS family sensor histidine kinase [Campylobacter troglodytis]TQR61151.1 sensor histidine kinase [Campylobacter troglodytis]
MRYYSIRFKISVLFAIVFALIAALFIICINLAIDSSHQEQNEYNEKMVNQLLSTYSSNNKIDVVEYLDSRGFNVIKDQALIKRIKEDGKELFRLETNLSVFSSISYRDAVLLRIENQDYDLLLTTKKKTMSFEVILFGFLLSLFITLLLYLSIIRSLNPLERLRRQIAKTMSGEDFHPSEYTNDEIGEIATEFLITLKKMKELIESRQLFLRTIMHEFKTPIGKGRIVAEMVKEEKQKKRLITIFKRLNALIDESAKIESLFSKNYKLNIRPYSFNEILAKAKKLLLDGEFDKNIIIKKNDNPFFNVDLDIFALVLKNLIDNALKYSDDGLCLIECFENCIYIKNKGRALKYDYKEYVKAFVRDKDNSVEGMGLGLYIVDKTCKSHNFDLSYSYVDSLHSFKITTPPPLSTKNKSIF